MYVGIDEHRQHALRLVSLDEPHAAHVGGEVEYEACTARGLIGGGALAQVELPVLHVGKSLVPLVQGLDVHRADPPVAFASQLGHEVPADEPAAAGDKDQVLFSDKGLHAHESGYLDATANMRLAGGGGSHVPR